MRYRLPSLNALRAFEAAARLGSISAAAKEGNVSPGAISRHIALLEKFFDCQLLERESRGVALTPRGEDYFKDVSSAFETLDLASNKLHLRSATKAVSIRAHTTFASEWLLPKLDAFRLINPGVDLRVDVSLKPINFDANEVDLGLVRRDHVPPDVEYHDLFSPVFIPVVSKGYLDTCGTLGKPSDLAGCRLLVSEIQKATWKNWFKLAGVSEVDLDGGVHFENSSLAYRAAREGLGVALGQRLLIADDVRTGRLEVPFLIGLQSENIYTLAISRRGARNSNVTALSKWIINEVKEAETKASHILGNIKLSRVM